MEEEALLLGAHRSLVGIYTPTIVSGPGHQDKLTFIFLNAGLIHHVGPERLHVKLARALASQGISSLRVDLSGIGDSSVRPDSLPPEDLAVREPKEIMDDLVRRGDKNFVLFGICSGAKYALQAAAADERVRALVLVNMALSDDVTSNQSTQAQAQYYLRHSLWNPHAWINLLRGKVNYKRLFKTFINKLRIRATGDVNTKSTIADIVRAELEPALAQDIKLLMLRSDKHAQYERLLDDELQDLQQSGQLNIQSRSGTDHLFTPLIDQEWLIEQVSSWAKSI